jgi:hypothetical protein
MGMTVIPLKDFFGQSRPDARGIVFVWNDKPFIQLHLFDDDYTLFWLGQTTLPGLARAFSHVTEVSQLLLNQHGSRLTLWSRIDVDAIGNDSGLVSLWNSRDGQSGSRRLVETADRLRSSTFETFFISGDSRPYRLKLWGEAQHTNNPDSDIGMTSDLPLVEEAIRPLLLETALIRPNDNDALSYSFEVLRRETKSYMRIV